MRVLIGQNMVDFRAIFNRPTRNPTRPAASKSLVFFQISFEICSFSLALLCGVLLAGRPPAAEDEEEEEEDDDDDDDDEDELSISIYANSRSTALAAIMLRTFYSFLF